MDIRDSQRIKEIRDNTRAMAEAFGRIADTLAEALELYVSTQTETQNSNLTFEKADEPQTEEHCETCKHKDECEGATYEYKNTEWWCLAYAPIEDEPQTDCAWK